MAQIIKKEEDDQRQLHVTVEIPEEDVQKAMREKARKFGREMRFPGFRPGKVPYPVVVGRFGENTLRAEALEDMLDNVFQQTQQELDEPPYLQAEVVHLELKPMQVAFVFPMRPIVKLGDYRALRQELPPTTISEETIAAALEDIRARHSVVETVERPADFDDLITVSGTGRILNEDGEPDEIVLETENQDLLLDNNQLVFGAEFVTHLVGMAAGEEKMFRVTLPDNFPTEAHAGKPAEFNLTITAVKRRELPELNDELAQAEGDYETLDDLRAAMRADLHAHMAEQTRMERLDQMMINMLADATLIYPPASVKHEVDHIIEDLQKQVKRAGWEWEEYVKEVYETEAALREHLQESGVDRLEKGLILRQFIQDERLSIKQAELEARANKRLEGVDEQMRGYLFESLTKGRGMESVANEVMLDKVHERIEAILNGVAPDLEALQASDEEE